MSFETDFDTAFTILLGKARGAITTTGTPPGSSGGGGTTTTATRPATMAFEWTGGGRPISVTTIDPILIEVPFQSRIVWAHLFAGDGQGNRADVSSEIELRVTNESTFGTSTPAYGSGTKPTLSDQASRDLDLSNWLLNYDAGDALLAYVTSFSGSATWLTLTLQLLPAVTTVGVSDVINTDGDSLTSADGSTMTFRT